jgi:hypothetical protein
MKASQAGIYVLYPMSCLDVQIVSFVFCTRNEARKINCFVQFDNPRRLMNDES